MVVIHGQLKEIIPGTSGGGGAWALGGGLSLASHSPRFFRRVVMTSRSSMKLTIRRRHLLALRVLGPRDLSPPRAVFKPE
jgi:hypothetical protein